MSKENAPAGANDSRFEGIHTYAFKDINGLSIPNSLGYAAVRCIKGHANIWASDAAAILAQYDREDLYRMTQEHAHIE